MDKLKIINSKSETNVVEVYHINNYPWKWNPGMLASFVNKEGHYYMVFLPERTFADYEENYGYVLREGQLKTKPQPIDYDDWIKTHHPTDLLNGY